MITNYTTITNLTLEQENEELRGQVADLQRKLTTIEAEPVELDKYEIAIRDYIGDNAGVTENKVRTEMDKQGICSPLTALKKIRHLLELGIIEDRKVGNRFHELHLSDKTDFNRINKQLSKIVIVLNALQDPRYNKFRLDKKEKDIDAPEFDIWFKVTCLDPIDTILSILLFHTKNEKLSKNDYRELATKIITLALKARQLSWRDHHDPSAKVKITTMLECYKAVFDRYKDGYYKLSEDMSSEYAVAIGLNSRITDNMISCIEDIRRDFL